MIFVFVEDGSLEIVASLGEAQQNYNAVDVESEVFQFFDERGIYLKPQFTKPNRIKRLLGIFKRWESGEFKLVPQTETDEDINLYLLETNEIKPNPWFSSIDEVRQLLLNKKG